MIKIQGVNEKHLTKVVLLYNVLVQYYSLNYTGKLIKFMKSGKEIIIFKVKQKDLDSHQGLLNVIFIDDVLNNFMSANSTISLTRTQMKTLNNIFKKLKNLKNDY